ncbi:MAG: hypothetical protein NW224_16860 [Leptolyngbyaceae cyanobacterium bins.302]|nr:hypothetical protein [Leptolyngbyaceae cyanobacterium bins.302]
MPKASGQRGAYPKFYPVVGCLSPPDGLPFTCDRIHSPVRAAPTVPRCQGGESFWLCRRSLPPHPTHPEPNEQGSGLPPLAVPRAVVGQGCLIKSVSLTQAFPVCSAPVWQGCRPSVPGALAFPASLARSVPGFRSVGWAGWLGLRRSRRFPPTGGFPLGGGCLSLAHPRFPRWVLPSANRPSYPSVAWCPSRLSRPLA